jgi:hypothetical protein
MGKELSATLVRFSLVAVAYGFSGSKCLLQKYFNIFTYIFACLDKDAVVIQKNIERNDRICINDELQVTWM